MSAWRSWCRLCAREEAHVQLPSAIVTKYLAIPLQIQPQNAYPSTICQNCSDRLSSFDNYALQCEKVQSMFRSLFDENDTFRDITSCRLFKKNYLQCETDEKFIPICDLKAEDNELNGDCENSSKNTLKKILIRDPWSKTNNEYGDDYAIKNETDGDTFEPAQNSCTDDDYDVPLSSISGLILERKRKSSKKVKHSPKKRKKSSKSKNKSNPLDDIVNDNDIAIKTELVSDEENAGQAINKTNSKTSDESKKIRKREKREYVDSILSFDCYICKENCKNWHALCLHFRDVHNTRAKVLCCCGKYLASRVSIGRHCANHGRSDSFNCTKCTKRFPRDSELQSHMITHLPKEEHPFVCCKCARRFTTQQLLRHHEKKHIPMEERMTHPCLECKSKFTSKSSLLMHVKAVHERLKPFVCDQCGSAFTTKGILEEHKVRHSDERPHVCSVCQKSFKTKQRLAIHSDTHNDTVYQCPHCPMQLNSRRTLRMHLFVHDDFFRYQCNFCEKAFRRAKDLKNHNNLHTGRRPYSCPWCSRTFANGSNCRAHKRRMHPHELRLFDATEAMRNKVPVPTDMQNDEKKDLETATPKVIFANLKRKKTVPSPNKMPNFTISPDVSEKTDEVLSDNDIKKPRITSMIAVKYPGEGNTTPTKQEKTSPIHTYESSLSPLNLNASAMPSKYHDIRVESGHITINTEVAQNEEFQEPTNNFGHVQNSIVQNRNQIPSAFTDGEYKEMQDHVFNKSSQIYTNFSENNIYDGATAIALTPSFPNANPYSVHYNRDNDN